MTQCPHCKALRKDPSGQRNIHREGRFFRSSDGQWISRFWCLLCKKSFSYATTHPCFRQKKRQMNEPIRKHAVAGVSHRESARILNLNRKTIERKLRYWAAIAKQEVLSLHQRIGLQQLVEFDEMESFIHTKCKPVSIPLMVVSGTRYVLGLGVASMPAKGRLAALAFKKYGPRVDERRQVRSRVLEFVKTALADSFVIKSDSHPLYPGEIRRHLPGGSHIRIKGKRGAITGQGELKKIGYDPIFSLNHTCAMVRAKVSRMIRRTWNTSKRADRLEDHLWIYAMSHNRRIEKNLRKKAQRLLVA